MDMQMYKAIYFLTRATVGLIVALTITACGAGNSPQQNSMYTIVLNNRSILVEGQGIDTLSQEYDAVAYVVSMLKTDSVEYKQMLSDNGLLVVIKDKTGKTLTAVVTMRADGLHIVIN